MPNSNRPVDSKEMAKGFQETTSSLQNQQDQLDSVAKMLPVIPDSITHLSTEIAAVISTFTSFKDEIDTVSEALF